MLFKTHIVFTLFSVLFLIDHVHYKFAFVVVALVAGVLPDIDSGFSTLGKHRLFRPVQLFTRHRGIIHSFTLCILVTLALAAYFPIYSLPFFLGYSLHLFADCFTVEGIRPFWPFKFESKGPLRVGSALEEVLFIGFCIVDVVLVASFFF